MQAKQRNLYIVLGVLLVASLGFIFLYKKGSPKPDFTHLQERKGTQKNSKEFKDAYQQSEGIIKSLEVKPDDAESELKLAKIYIEEARITGNHAYYDPATLALLDHILQKNPQQFEAICFKAIVLLSQHHFSEGLVEAEKANAIYPDLAYSYGLVCDANVELGNYDKAVESADKMNGIRPDLASYSRVSYLREIFGDIKGARDAMKLAVDAGAPGSEGVSWCRCITGRVSEYLDDTFQSHYQYAFTLSQRMDYPYALAGMGRLAKRNKKYNEAIKYFQQADGLIDDYSFSVELADIYNILGKKEEESKAYENALSKLRFIAGDDKNPGHGHYSDRELANVYAQMGDPEKALKHALIEYNRRPKNIDVNETLAWVKFLKGDMKEANEYINVALSTHSKNPTLLCKAAIIKNSAGETELSQKLMKEAESGSETWSNDLRTRAKSIDAGISAKF